jgi:hypothetical protein
VKRPRAELAMSADGTSGHYCNGMQTSQHFLLAAYEACECALALLPGSVRCDACPRRSQQSAPCGFSGRRRRVRLARAPSHWQSVETDAPTAEGALLPAAVPRLVCAATCDGACATPDCMHAPACPRAGGFACACMHIGWVGGWVDHCACVLCVPRQCCVRSLTGARCEYLKANKLPVSGKKDDLGAHARHRHPKRSAPRTSMDTVPRGIPSLCMIPG